MNRKGKKKRPYRLIALLANLGTVALLAAAACIGAPKSRADLETMTVERYENWRARLEVVFEEAAVVVARHDPETVDHARAALLALSGQPIPAGAVSALAGEYAGLVRLAMLELHAVLGETEHAPTARITDLLASCAHGLETGKLRAAAEVASPVPDPESGP